MDEQKKAKIQQFVNDKAMSEAVLSVFAEVFTKPSKDRDVAVLAARYLSLENLAEVRRVLQNYAAQTEEDINTKHHLGL